MVRDPSTPGGLSCVLCSKQQCLLFYLREFTSENMKGCCPRAPQQPNFSDCGLYLLQYAESFFEVSAMKWSLYSVSDVLARPPLSLSQLLQSPVQDFALPLTTLKHWFPRKAMREKREKIADIIRDLHQKQFPKKQVQFPKLVFTPESGAGYSSEEEEEDDDDEEEAREKEKGKEKKATAPTVRTINLSTRKSLGTAAIVPTTQAQKVIVPSILKVKQQPAKESEESSSKPDPSPKEGEKKNGSPSSPATDAAGDPGTPEQEEQQPKQVRVYHTIVHGLCVKGDVIFHFLPLLG